jgi:16S rRNA (uracil1498-N3)-methyltransferase
VRVTDLRRSAAHVIVDDLAVPVLRADDRHHLERVRRIRADEIVTVTDGRGSWRPCHLVGGALVEAGPVTSVERPSPSVAVGFAVVKGDRPEWVVQKLTELGVDRIVPLHTERSVVRWTGDRAERHLERLRTIVREAAMQSRQVWLPVVEPVTELADAVTVRGACFAEPGGGPLTDATTFVLIGPEGGFSPAELTAPIPRVGLPGGVLRAETAAVAAGVLLATLRA